MQINLFVVITEGDKEYSVIVYMF